MLSMPSPTIDPVIPNAPILVVDDDAKIVRLVRTYLERDGFTVVTAADGPAALDAIETHEPALVVLDLMLPELDGRAVIRAVRKDEEAAHTPILVLSARSSTIDRIAGLEDGADDHLPKPFSPAELVLRVKSILRRANSTGAPGSTMSGNGAKDDGGAIRATGGGSSGAGAGSIAVARSGAAAEREIRHADLTVDPARHEVRRDDGAIIDLTRVEFSLLTAILGADGRVLSRDQLLDAVYGADAAEVLDRTIDVHIRRLRDKLDDDPDAPRYVQTVRGVGYRAART
jgi:predicted outer membrane repeat protein